MKFSIVTISFNQARYLPEALDTVAAQREVECEHIVVDPGSTDGSREIIEERADSLKLVFERDNGPADGLNRGFARATGEVYGFVNADDYLLPGALEAVQKAFLANPDASIVFGGGMIVAGDGTVLRTVRAQGVTLKRFLHGGSEWIQQSVFFRAGAFKGVGGFRVENRSSWDGELIVSMLQAGAKVAYTTADLACFRIHDASITGTGSIAQRYHADRVRLFASVYPEGWTLPHKLLSLLYRVELAVRNPERIGRGIRQRLGGKR